MKFIKEKWLVEFWEHPGLKLLTCMLAAYIGCWLIIDFNIEQRIDFVFSYFFPVFVVFFLYFFDRLEFRQEYRWYGFGIDILVLFISMLRMVYKVPYISGHALFLSFALFTVKRNSTRVLTFMVWLQVLLLKVFLWHDITFWGGLVVGGFAALLLYGVNYFQKTQVSVEI